MIVLATALAVVAPAPSVGATAKQKQAKANAKAKKLIGDGRYVGARGDGLEFDVTFCKNGKFVDADGGGGKKWFVRNAKFGKRGFTATVAENRTRNAGGYTIAVGRRNGQWLIGISSFDEPSEFGKVVRSNAKQACAAL